MSPQDDWIELGFRRHFPIVHEEGAGVDRVARIVGWPFHPLAIAFVPGLLPGSLNTNFEALKMGTLGVLGVAGIAAAIRYTVGKEAYGYQGLGDVYVMLFFGFWGSWGGASCQARRLSYLVASCLVLGMHERGGPQSQQPPRPRIRRRRRQKDHCGSFGFSGRESLSLDLARGGLVCAGLVFHGPLEQRRLARHHVVCPARASSCTPRSRRMAL